MGRRPRSNHAGPHGVVCLDKPSGPTSFAVLRQVQRQLGSGRAGHAGTLDPMASGVLVALMGEATKISDWLLSQDKRYLARIRLGAHTSTLDAEGEVVATAPIPDAARDFVAVRAILSRFVGTYEQIPPRFSAIKKGGRSLMSRARAGEDFEPEARTVRCESLVLKEIIVSDEDPAGVEWLVEVHSGKGFYVRSLGRDVARAVGTEGHLSGLRRIRSGYFDIDRASTPEAVEARGAEVVIPIPDALSHEYQFTVRGDELRDLKHGKPLSLRPDDSGADRALVIDPDRNPIALMRKVDGRWKVARGFHFTSGVGVS